MQKPKLAMNIVLDMDVYAAITKHQDARREIKLDFRHTCVRVCVCVYVHQLNCVLSRLVEKSRIIPLPRQRRDFNIASRDRAPNL